MHAPSETVVLDDAAGLAPRAALRTIRTLVVSADPAYRERARRAVAALAETAPRTGVVVVCQHCTPAARDLRALPKWGWTQDLLAAIERAADDGNPTIPAARRPLRRHPAASRGAGIAAGA